MTRALVLLVALAGCGDDLLVDDVVTATSGDRLMVQWYRYTDGALQHGDELYDLVEHTACAPATWADGVTRCVPVAEEAMYTDAACTAVVGRSADPREDPTHYVGYDRVAGVRVPTRLYRAGGVIPSVDQFYARLDGECVGPFSSPIDGAYHRITGEVDARTLIALHERVLGTGRLGVDVLEGDDGLRLPRGLRDRALAARCAPSVGSDGLVRCRPLDAAPAGFFRDPGCEEPAIAVNEGFEVPRVLEIVEPSGCRAHRLVGAEVGGPLFRREGAVCRAIPVTLSTHVFAAGPDIAPPVLEQTIEEVAGRRLQRIILRDGGLAVPDDRLYDLATRAPCRRQSIDGTERCVPALLAPASTLATPGCGLSVPVVELPRRSCEEPAFASSFTSDRSELHAIGAPVTEALYRFDGITCAPYTPVDGAVVHAIGPPLDPELFLDAIVFGER